MNLIEKIQDGAVMKLGELLYLTCHAWVKKIALTGIAVALGRSKDPD